MRTALSETAAILTEPVKARIFKRWAMRLAARAGTKKAKVALAGKLSVILQRGFRDRPMKLGGVMPRACSLDLRQGLIDAVEAGSSARAVARRLQVSVSTPVKWVQRKLQGGSVEAKPMQGQPSAKLALHKERRLQMSAEESDLTLSQIGARLKSGPDGQKRRAAGRRVQPWIDPNRLMCLDETGVTTELTPAHWASLADVGHAVVGLAALTGAGRAPTTLKPLAGAGRIWRSLEAAVNGVARCRATSNDAFGKPDWMPQLLAGLRGTWCQLRQLAWKPSCAAPARAMR